MADNTNYIGVAMGLDVSDLKAGLSEANKQIQLANSEFKAAASGMDDWTKSTEGVTAKVKQLDTVLKMQKSKLAGLSAEYEKVAREQGENSEAARKLKVQINNQQAVVNKTEKEFNDYTDILKQAEAGTLDLSKATIKGGKAIQDMGDSAGDAGGKLDGIKGVAGGVAGGLLALGGAVAGAVGGFLSLAESTREARENMAKLEAGFTTAGHSAADAEKTYKELYGLLGDEGQATEAAAHLAQLTTNQEELAAWTDIATGVYATFGASLPIENLAEASNETAKTGKLTGGLADALNWAGVNEEQFQAKLDAASTEQERQALITETLNGLYSEQSDKFKELNADIIASREADAELTQAMSELGAIAEPIMTTLKLLAVDLLGAITPFVELIGTGLKGAFEGTAGSAQMLAEGIGGIVSVIVDRFTNLLPTVLNIILQLIPQIADTLLSALPQLLEVVINLAVEIINLLSTLLPQILAKIVELVPMLIEQLIAAIPMLLEAAITLLMAIVQALPTIITSLLNALPSLIDTIITVVLEAFPMLIEAAIKLFMALIEALPVIIKALSANLPKVIDTIITGLVKALPLVLDAAIKLLMAVVQALPTLIKYLVAELPSIQITIIGALLKAIPSILAAAVKLFFGILGAIPQIISELVKSIPSIITAIVNGLKDGISKVKSVGKDVIRGLWEGIKDMSGWISKKLDGFGSGVLNGIKDFFGISSPSKLIEEEVGVNVGKAFVPSRPRALAQVKKQLAGFSDYVSDNLGDIKAGLSIDAGGVSGTGRIGNGGYTVVNAGMTVNYNGRLSRKQLKQSENDHYIAVKTRLRNEGAI